MIFYCVFSIISINIPLIKCGYATFLNAVVVKGKNDTASDLQGTKMVLLEIPTYFLNNFQKNSWTFRKFIDPQPFLATN